MSTDDQIDRFRRLSGLDIFEMNRGREELGGYKFVCPGVMLSADDVNVGFSDGLWHLSYTDTCGHTWTGVAESQVAAYLALIADRYGLIATFTSKPDEVEEPS